MQTFTGRYLHPACTCIVCIYHSYLHRVDGFVYFVWEGTVSVLKFMERNCRSVIKHSVWLNFCMITCFNGSAWLKSCWLISTARKHIHGHKVHIHCISFVTKKNAQRGCRQSVQCSADSWAHQLEVQMESQIADASFTLKVNAVLAVSAFTIQLVKSFNQV